MAQLTLHYKEEYGLDGLVLEPFRMVMRFNSGQIKWHKSLLYLPFYTEYDQIRAEDYHEDISSIMLLPDELFVDSDIPDHFGIYLPMVIARFEKTTNRSFDEFSDEIEQFIIRLDDLERVLRLNLRPFYIWRE